MRIIALLGLAAVVAGCSTKETPPAADTTAMAPAAAPAADASLGRFAGLWNVNIKPQGQDTVVSTFVLDARDSTAWSFAFPNGKPVAMRITGVSGDTVMVETDTFESSVRKGMMARTNFKAWLQDGKLMATHEVHYETTGPDTVRIFDSEGTKQ